MFEFHHVDLTQVARLEKAHREELIRQIQEPPAGAESAPKRSFRFSSWLGSLLISVGTKLQGPLVVQEVHPRKR